MSTYNGATFTPLMKSDGTRAEWVRAKNNSRAHIPYSNIDVRQTGGTGNPIIELPVMVESDAAMALLQAVEDDGNARTLGDFRGQSIANVELTNIDLSPGRHALSETWLVTLTFEQRPT
jgi:hypothetical protein